MASDERVDRERSEELIFELLSNAGLPMPDEVRRELDTGKLTLLWHEQKLAVVVDDQDDAPPV